MAGFTSSSSNWTNLALYLREVYMAGLDTFLNLSKLSDKAKCFGIL